MTIGNEHELTSEAPMPIRRDRKNRPADDGPLRVRTKAVPFEFVLDALAPISPWTRPMFGCHAIYVREKIVMLLRDKDAHAGDNGLWLATGHEHHESLRSEFPNMRSIALLGKNPTGWQVLPADAPDFEEAATHAVELVLRGDPRIGKIPKSRNKRKSSGMNRS